MTRADRLQAAWLEIETALREKRPNDFSHIPGLTEEEEPEALNLFVAGWDTKANRVERLVRMVAFLDEHAPGIADVGEAIASLNLFELEDLLAVLREEGN